MTDKPLTSTNLDTALTAFREGLSVDNLRDWVLKSGGTKYKAVISVTLPLLQLNSGVYTHLATAKKSLETRQKLL